MAATLLAALTIAASASDQSTIGQPVTAPALTLANVPPVDTNGLAKPDWTTVPAAFGTLWDFTIGHGLTNLIVFAGGTYTPSIKAWGAEFGVARRVDLGSGFALSPGVFLDYYGEKLYAVNMQANIGFTTFPFGGTNVAVTWFGVSGIGAPWGENYLNSSTEVIWAGGLALRVAHVLGGVFDIAPIYGTRSGLGTVNTSSGVKNMNGAFYGASALLTWLL